MCRDAKVGCDIRYCERREEGEGESFCSVVSDAEFEVLEVALRQAERERSVTGNHEDKTTPEAIPGRNPHSKAFKSDETAAELQPARPTTTAILCADEHSSPDVVIQKITR